MVTGLMSTHQFSAIYDPERHHRRSLRLKGFDYAQHGAYFITMCTEGRALLLGEIEDGDLHLSGGWHERCNQRYRRTLRADGMRR